jgi:nicotinamide riboside kinase
MRIGFIGSHSTGKTSVALRLAEEHRNILYVPSASRKVLADGMPLNRQADEVSQILTTLARVVDEQSAYEENADKIILSDRTPLDSLAYTKYQIDAVWGGEHKFYWDYSEKFVKSAMLNYDLVFYFPVGQFALTPDGVRDTDEYYRERIDEIIEDLLGETELLNPYITMIDGSVAERTEFVKQQIRRYTDERPWSLVL